MAGLAHTVEELLSLLDKVEQEIRDDSDRESLQQGVASRLVDRLRSVANTVENQYLYDDEGSSLRSSVDADDEESWSQPNLQVL